MRIPYPASLLTALLLTALCASCASGSESGPAAESGGGSAVSSMHYVRYEARPPLTETDMDAAYALCRDFLTELHYGIDEGREPRFSFYMKRENLAEYTRLKVKGTPNQNTAKLEFTLHKSEVRADSLYLEVAAEIKAAYGGSMGKLDYFLVEAADGYLDIADYYSGDVKGMWWSFDYAVRGEFAGLTDVHYWDDSPQTAQRMQKAREIPK